MWIVSVVVFIIIMGLMFCSRKESIREYQLNKWLEPFARIWIWAERKAGKTAKSIKKKYSRRILTDMQTLYPGQHTKQRIKTYYLAKLSILLAVFFLGNIFVAGLSLNGQYHSQLVENTRLMRKEWGMGAVDVFLKAIWQEEETKLHYQIKERQYSRKEADLLQQEAYERLLEEMKGQNASLEEVQYPLKLVRRLKQYPFALKWESNNYKRIDTTGAIKQEDLPKEGEEVILTVWFTYEDYQWIEEIVIRMIPLTLSPAELLEQRILQQIEKSNLQTRQLAALQLPTVLDGKQIIWKEIKKDDSGAYLILLLMLIGGIYIGYDRDLHKKVEKRNHTLILEYAEFICKLTLYMGAGVTIKNAWKRMATEYSKQRCRGGNIRQVYEELLVCVHEFENGLSEAQVYYNFGRRCQDRRYKKCGALLAGSLQKGNEKILLLLHQETVQALTDRKSQARKLAKEAETKLLIPMVLMLMLVMAMIMIPAYFSFR